MTHDGIEITDYSLCLCGSITIHTSAGNYSAKQANIDAFIPSFSQDKHNINQLQTTYACDHCANGYGLDICACGSRMPTKECDEGFDECGTPMQIYGGKTEAVAEGSWGE